MTRRNTEAVRRWRARQAGLAPQLPRCSCGRTAIGVHAPLCSRCYWDSPAGRAEKVQRRRKARQAARQS